MEWNRRSCAYKSEVELCNRKTRDSKRYARLVTIIRIK